MRKNMVTVVLAAVLCFISASGIAAEEVFDSKAAEQHTGQGIEFLKAKQLDPAIAEFEQSAEIAPEAEAYYYLGYAYYLKGKKGDKDSRKKSREYFEKAYEIDPNFSPSRYQPAEETPAEAQHRETPEAGAVSQATTTSEPVSAGTQTPQAVPEAEQSLK